MRDDRLAAAVLGEAAELAIRGRRDPGVARVYLELYGAKLRRIEADEGIRATFLDRRGEFALLTGDAEGALVSHEGAVALHPPGDLVGRARSLRGIANALAELGRFDASIERLSEARELLTRELGAYHPATARVEMNLAQSLWEHPEATVDDLVRAERLLRGALEVVLRDEGSEGVGVARVRMALSVLLEMRGETTAALREVDRATSVLSTRLSPTHNDLVTARSLAFNLHLERREWTAAGDEAAALLRIYARRGEPLPLDMLLNVGEMHVRLGDPLAATPFFDQALALATLADPPQPMLVCYALNGRAKVHLLRGDVVQARAIYEQAMGQAEALAEPTPELQAELKWGLAQALIHSGTDVPRARRMAAEAQAILKASTPEASYLADLEAIHAP